MAKKVKTGVRSTESQAPDYCGGHAAEGVKTPVLHTQNNETYKRLAQTELPGGKIVEREWTPHEQYQLYASGFRDGAGSRAMDKDREGLGAYDRGYADGKKARGAALKKYAKEIGYKPTILRLQGGS
jgi:hypothetical protein